MAAPERPLVLVTGGTGFIAAHCIARLLEEGYPVRTTVRSPERASVVRDMVGRAGQDASDVEVVVADLESDADWAAALAGCEDVLHVASPVPHGDPKDPDEVVRPAREGTLRVLRAAREAGTKRVVLTSAFGAIGFGWGPTDHVFTEADWSKLDGPNVSTYNRSKTWAEQAAWEFVADGKGPELVTICPVAVFGPILGDAVSGGNEVGRRLLNGQLPVLLDLWFPIVDVRDVAAAEVAALGVPEAAGERFIISSGEGMTMPDMARLLREELGEDGRRIPRVLVPSGLVRGVAKVFPPLREFALSLGSTKTIDGSKARRVLGLRPRPAREAVLASGRTILERGIVKPSRRGPKK